MQCCCAVAGGKGVLSTGIGSKFFLKGSGLGTVGQPLLLHRLSDSFIFFLVKFTAEVGVFNLVGDTFGWAVCCPETAATCA